MTNEPKHHHEDLELHMADHFHARHAHKYVSAYMFVILLLGATGATYTWQHKNVELESARVRTLQTQLESAQKSYNEAMAAAPKQ